MQTIIEKRQYLIPISESLQSKIKEVLQNDNLTVKVGVWSCLGISLIVEVHKNNPENGFPEKCPLYTHLMLHFDNSGPYSWESLNSSRIKFRKINIKDNDLETKLVNWFKKNKDMYL